MKSLLKALFFSFLLIGSALALADNVKEGNRLYDAGRYEEAMHYYLKPDAVANPATMNRIGYMYDAGQGVKKTLTKPNAGTLWRKKRKNANSPDQFFAELVFLKDVDLKKITFKREF